MVFYTWYDDMSGCFNFSLIPANWSKLPKEKELPFGCITNKYKCLDEVVEEYVNDPYKGRIPESEFTEVDILEELDDSDIPNEHVVNVWLTIL